MTSDATHTYRGYRLQALYGLSRILSEDDSAPRVYQPEGAEDLSVLDKKGNLLEVNQVKSHSRDLTLSDFKPDKRNSFFYRAARHFEESPDAKIAIVSYGPVGHELLRAIEVDGRERKRAARKIADFGFLSETEAHALLGRLETRQVDEQELTRQVYSHLSNSLMGIDSRAAFELLHYWVTVCSESRQKITEQDLINRANEVGEFLSERAAHIREWGSAIVSILDRNIDEQTGQELAEEFYGGISARYDHVLADLDVIRGDLLQEISSGFRRANIVILHGASGQGKTTLAYRYLREFFPDQWRFQVKLIESRRHAYSLVEALAGQADAMKMMPVAVYLDVAASDKDWPEFVRELSVHPSIRVLVAVREEDFQRATISGASIRFVQVALSFREQEARQVYQALVEKQVHPGILNFEDAWRQFGGEGPLMEFVHMVTQGGSIHERLAQQVARLENDVAEGRLSPEEMRLLRLVALASAYEARLKLRPLIESLHLAAPLRTLRIFEKEYLLRTSEDGSLATGLHPIRSMILADLLSDPTLAPWSESAQACLPLVYEPDMESFLLYAFSRRPEDSESLCQALATFQPERWVAVAGIIRALIWLGTREYVSSNRQLIKDAFKDSGRGWWMALDFDLADTMPGSAPHLWETMRSLLPEDRTRQLESFQSRQTDKRTIFVRARDWLAKLTCKPASPHTDAEWSGFGESLFWAGRFSRSWQMDQWKASFSLDEPINSLPIEVLADVVVGVAHGYPSYFSEWMVRGRYEIHRRFRQATKTVAIEDDGQKVTVHYVVELEPSYGPESFIGKRIRAAKDPIHEETIARLGLLSKLLPDRLSFAAQGYGHRVWQEEALHDATRKIGIDRRHLPPDWLTSVGATFRSLAERDFRPKTWLELANQVQTLRSDVTVCFEQLNNGLRRYFQKRRLDAPVDESIDMELWEHCVNRLNRLPFLPLCAVDEWGLMDESVSRPLSEGNGRNLPAYRRGLASSAHRSFLDAFCNYSNHLSNFLGQSPQIMVINSILGRNDKSPKIRSAQKATGKQLGAEETGRLSTYNLTKAVESLYPMQREFRHLLGQYVAAEDLARLERMEQILYHTLWDLWCHFESHPQRVVESIKVITEQGTESLNRMRRRFQKEIKKASDGEVKISIAPEGLHWEDSPALWVTVDAKFALDAYGALDTVVAALRTAAETVPDAGFRQHLLDLNWQFVVIVPLVHGRSLLGTAQCFHFFSLLSENELTQWQLRQHPIPTDTMAALRIETWEHANLEPAQRYMSSMSNLSLYAAHIADFARLPELDIQGLSQLREYLDNTQARASELLQKSLDAAKVMMDIFNRLRTEEITKHPHLVSAVQKLIEIQNHILPTNEFSGQARLDLDGVVGWARRLANAQESAGLIYLLWATDVIMTMDQK